MTLELMINGNKEVFSNIHVTGMMYRDALYLRHRQVMEVFTPSLLDEMVGFICEVFGNKFTISQFYDGMDKRQIFGAVNNIIDAVITQDCTPREISINKEETRGDKDLGITIKELQNALDMVYLSLIRQGYKLKEIDEMDINFYSYLINKSVEEEKVFIDDIF